MKLKILSGLLVLSLFLLATPLLAQTPSPLPSVIGRRLNNGKLTACQARESAIKNRMQSLTDLVSNMENKFDDIATRVKNYYTNTVLPSGKKVSNYDALVADIATKKNAVTTALDKAKTDASSFSCKTDNPKALYIQFRLNMQTVKIALKNFRTAVKNLIVAVRGVAPSTSPTATPKP